MSLQFEIWSTALGWKDKGFGNPSLWLKLNSFFYFSHKKKLKTAKIFRFNMFKDEIMGMEIIIIIYICRT